MLKKYIKQWDNIFEYVRNRTVIGVLPGDIAIEVKERFSPEILFPDADALTLQSILDTFTLYAYFMYHNTTYKEVKNGSAITANPTTGLA